MKRRIISALVISALSISGLAFTARVYAQSASSEHERIINFWTKARVAKAVSRDFMRDTKTGRFTQRGGRFDSGFVTGASWGSGGVVKTTTGKVLFSMGANYYLCSASVVDDTVSTRSIISTAAHCVYDEVNGKFADNWMFIPDYDSQPVSLTSDGSFCANTKYGCWTAASKIVASNYAYAGAFNAQAVMSDYAFVSVGVGGRSLAQLDTTVGSQPIAFAHEEHETNTWDFGYPAAGRYKGADLMYCNGLAYFDLRMDYETYQLSCALTAGSSGGPWFKDFSSDGLSVGQGTQFSVNSYSYNGSKNMYGPKFNSETQGMYNSAMTMSTNSVYP